MKQRERVSSFIHIEREGERDKECVCTFKYVRLALILHPRVEREGESESACVCMSKYVLLTLILHPYMAITGNIIDRIKSQGLLHTTHPLFIVAVGLQVPQSLRVERGYGTY